MKRHILLPGSMLVLMSLVALGADVAGKWTAEVQGRNGATTQTLMLKTSGSTLTGSLDRGRGMPDEITDGKVDGDNVSFTITRQGRNGEVKTMYKGTLMGDDLKLTATREGGQGGGGGRGGPQDLTFKRTK